MMEREKSLRPQLEGCGGWLRSELVVEWGYPFLGSSSTETSFPSRTTPAMSVSWVAIDTS